MEGGLEGSKGWWVVHVAGTKLYWGYWVEGDWLKKQEEKPLGSGSGMGKEG
jgi:hypothetical protein